MPASREAISGWCSTEEALRRSTQSKRIADTFDIEALALLGRARVLRALRPRRAKRIFGAGDESIDDDAKPRPPRREQDRSHRDARTRRLGARGERFAASRATPITSSTMRATSSRRRAFVEKISARARPLQKIPDSSPRRALRVRLRVHQGKIRRAARVAPLRLSRLAVRVNAHDLAPVVGQPLDPRLPFSERVIHAKACSARQHSTPWPGL